MATIKLSGFLGENRALHPMLLPDSVGVTSRNHKPGRADLRPWKSPLTVASVPSGRKTLYRMGRDVASDATYWLSWTTVVKAVRGFDAADTTERTYYSGDGAPKVSDNTIALASTPYPTASRPLGLPAPTGAPLLSAAGGVSTLTDSYFYVYTFVNDWGWESAPSPPSAALLRKPDATTTISGFSAVPAGNYNINRRRLYRTQAASDGSAEFFFLREITIGLTSTTDDNRTLGEVMPTTTWLTPPDNLSELTALWNGMLAGISAGAVRFCEPYTPYAWPIAYDVVPPDSKAVALGVFGQSLLVLTTGRPLLVAGSGPDSMDQQRLEMSQGCIAPQSVVSMGVGVAWASNDGLCFYGSGGARVLTAGLMLRDDWQALVPSSIIGQMYEGLYLGSYNDGSGRKAFLIDPASPTGLYFLDTGYEAMHFDELQDQLYVLSGASVQRWDAGTAMTVTFKSKLFRLPKPTQAFACAEVTADAYPVTAKFYADGVLKHTQTVASATPFRLPAGFLAQTWQFELSGTSAIQGLAIAHSMQELAQA
ncbi:hypothetical protein [Polaromonas sp. CG9_12]|nr:hypothetical protein [Polaromonas sp. CG9_12]